MKYSIKMEYSLNPEYNASPDILYRKEVINNAIKNVRYVLWIMQFANRPDKIL
jgi:hypothetical protein